MLASLLLTLREGLEAALILGIVLGLLAKLKRSELNRFIWRGAGVGLLASIVAAVALDLLGMEFEGQGEQIFEGVAMLLAAGVLTWMILWVHRSSNRLKETLESQTRAALSSGSHNGLFMLAFLAVFREGIELALFLLAVQRASSPLQTLIGALAGLAGAAGLGWLMFNSSRRLSLRGFFQATNVLLIIFAAGMVASGVHEFLEAGFIQVLANPVWDLGAILSNESELGMLLKALAGYNARPTLAELLAYWVYSAGIIAVLLARRPKPVPAAGTAP